MHSLSCCSLQETKYQMIRLSSISPESSSFSSNLTACSASETVTLYDQAPTIPRKSFEFWEACSHLWWRRTPSCSWTWSSCLIVLRVNWTGRLPRPCQTTHRCPMELVLLAAVMRDFHLTSLFCWSCSSWYTFTRTYGQQCPRDDRWGASTYCCCPQSCSGWA